MADIRNAIDVEMNESTWANTTEAAMNKKIGILDSIKTTHANDQRKLRPLLVELVYIDFQLAELAALRVLIQRRLSEQFPSRRSQDERHQEV